MIAIVLYLSFSGSFICWNCPIVTDESSVVVSEMHRAVFVKYCDGTWVRFLCGWT